jgi:hypothetical protein
VSDARNSEPIIRERHKLTRPHPFVGVHGAGSDLFDRAFDFEPYVYASFKVPPQPYRLVIFGEKTSLEDVLGPIASRFEADLYLPSGEISDMNRAGFAGGLNS